MTKDDSVKACQFCQHHVSVHGYDFCGLHQTRRTNVIKGTVSYSPMFCGIAREESRCGEEAKDYVHRGPEPAMSFIEVVKDFFSFLFCKE